MKLTVDINSDIGESFGMYKMGLDEQVINYISSANIACGFHAGDPVWMRRTVKLAEKHGVAVGAHPSFPDLAGFGRRNMSLTPEEVKADIVYQIGALQAFTKNKKLQHVKPHGAMYNQAVMDDVMAKAICESILEVDPNMILIALAGSNWVKIANSCGLRVASEAFADRAVSSNGSLVPRSSPRAVIHDISEVAQRGLEMVINGTVRSITGEEINIKADSICIHGDTPGAVNMAAELKANLEKAGVSILPINKFI